MEELIEVFEVDAHGDIMENYIWSTREIYEAIEAGRNIILHGWQDKRLFSPKWDFSLGEWVEGLSEAELQQRELDIIEEENQPSEFELLKKENEMLAMAIMELSSFMLEGGK